jgi:hypothetical protein
MTYNNRIKRYVKKIYDSREYLLEVDNDFFQENHALRVIKVCAFFNEDLRVPPTHLLYKNTKDVAVGICLSINIISTL